MIFSDIYVDDILSGEAKIEDTKKLQAQICELFLRVGFELHKWVSDSPDLLQDLSTSSYSFDKGQDVGPVKTLGTVRIEIQGFSDASKRAYAADLPNRESLKLVYCAESLECLR
ncbi:hypothetical protein AVEN_254159-1 [Araneus ventricosus]|uniref:Reverse transcriptase domain-containing protein n=1 Tax=Araneus ventricosus TaxID=182803 RepID=A0A4Y2JVA9_ARAVE|nr:hypothetical protein AVEN_254159-1 [Araneus ventricosus]